MLRTGEIMHTYMYVKTCILRNMHTYTACSETCIHTCMCMCVYGEDMHTYMYVYACMYVDYTHTYMYVYCGAD